MSARTSARSRSTRLGTAALLTAAVALSLAACTATPAASSATPGVSIDAGLVYSSPKGTDLKLDACTPKGATKPTPAVVLLHGGGFTEGDRASGGMRALCEYFADNGLAAFSLDYRLGAGNGYPAPLEDVDAAITWIRDDQHAARFNLRPTSIGILGSSAGAILAQTVATSGSGSLEKGTRVKAAVSLSGVSLMTEDALTLGSPTPQAAALILAYLGCPSPAADVCPRAAEASPELSVDSSDPPMILVNGSHELVPVEQATSMAEALKAAGVPVQLSVQDGSKHGVQLLGPDTRKRIIQFFTARLS